MNISSASLYDIATLGATYRSNYLEGFKCEERLQNNIRNWMSQGRPFPPPERITNWTARCDAAHDLRFDNLTYTRCLCKFKSPSFGYYMTLYRSFVNGILPFEGAATDQPASIMEIFNLIATLEAEKQEYEYSKQKKGR